VKLYNFFRSSASFRVRIALALKGLKYDYAPVHLTRGGGEQRAVTYKMLNPQQLVPVLEDGGNLLIQSSAIIEYLEEQYPEPPLLPANPLERARVRSIAQIVACEIHPVNNLRVLNYLSTTLQQNDDARMRWYRHWIAEGLSALEDLLGSSSDTGKFCHHDSPSLADCFLIPQLYNARRYECDLAGYPTLIRIESACLAMPEFERSRPENQPDAS